jgi:hypothetical protein
MVHKKTGNKKAGTKTELHLWPLGVALHKKVRHWIKELRLFPFYVQDTVATHLLLFARNFQCLLDPY